MTGLPDRHCGRFSRHRRAPLAVDAGVCGCCHLLFLRITGCARCLAPWLTLAGVSMMPAFLIAYDVSHPRQLATAALEARGFEVYLGGLHEYRPGRPSLSCDLIEPLRVPAVDRWVVAACGQGEFTPAQFAREENGGYRLVPTAFGRALYSWETAWQSSAGSDTLGRWLDTLTGYLRHRCQVTEHPADGTTDTGGDDTAGESAM